MAITQQDRQEWAKHSVTREFLEQLKQARQDTMETWATEGYVGRTSEEALLQNATALGGVRVLDQVIDAIATLNMEED